MQGHALLSSPMFSSSYVILFPGSVRRHPPRNQHQVRPVIMIPRTAAIILSHCTSILMLPRFRLQILGFGNHDALISAVPHIMHMESAISPEVVEWCDLRSQK